MIKKNIFAAMLLTVCSFTANAVLTPGEQYTVLKQPVTDAPKVVEFFSFYCGPCYQFTEQFPITDRINKILPAGEKVTKYHVNAMGKLGNELTEAWAIAIVMGKSDAVEKPLFEAVQKTRSLENIADIKTIFSHAGVTPAEYASAQNSLVVKALVAKQISMMDQFAVRGTPSFYVNGRYQVNNAGINATTPDEYASAFAGVIKQLLQ